MAINGRLSILYVDTTTPITTAGTAVTMANFKPVVCLTSNGFDGTTSPIDSTSKCTPNGFSESIDGVKSWTMSAEGDNYEKLVGETSTVVNHNDLHKMWKNGTKAWWMLADQENPEDSLSIRYGVGRVDGSSWNSPNNDKQTFSNPITGDGEIFDQDDLDVTP